MSIDTDPLLAALGSRWLLGVCALVLAFAAIKGAFLQTDQIDGQTAEQECRDAIDGVLTVEVAKSLGRIEAGLRALSVGDEGALSDAVTISDRQIDAYADAIDQRADAVALCAGRGG